MTKNPKDQQDIPYDYLITFKYIEENLRKIRTFFLIED